MITLINSGWKSGLREWILQRFTGIYIFFYFLFVLFYFLYSKDFSYDTLVYLYSLYFFKIITIIFIFNLALHINIGMNIILTDYVKNYIVRIILDFIINTILLFYIFFIMQIFWGF